MKITIRLKLDADILREIQGLAAEKGSSVGDMLAARMEQVLSERRSYARARKRALARLRAGLDLGGLPSRSREELHEH